MYAVLETPRVGSASYQPLRLIPQVPLPHQFELEVILVVWRGEGKDSTGVRLILFLYLSGVQGGRHMIHGTGLGKKLCINIAITRIVYFSNFPTRELYHIYFGIELH